MPTTTLPRRHRTGAGPALLAGVIVTLLLAAGLIAPPKGAAAAPVAATLTTYGRTIAVWSPPDDQGRNNCPSDLTAEVTGDLEGGGTVTVDVGWTSPADGSATPRQAVAAITLAARLADGGWVPVLPARVPVNTAPRPVTDDGTTSAWRVVEVDELAAPTGLDDQLTLIYTLPEGTVGAQLILTGTLTTTDLRCWEVRGATLELGDVGELAGPAPVNPVSLRPLYGGDALAVCAGLPRTVDGERHAAGRWRAEIVGPHPGTEGGEVTIRWTVTNPLGIEGSVRLDVGMLDRTDSRVVPAGVPTAGTVDDTGTWAVTLPPAATATFDAVYTVPAGPAGTVALISPNGWWTQLSPVCGTTVLDARDGVAVGYKTATPPTAVDDSVTIRAGETVDIPVLANDVAGTSPLESSTVTVIDGPELGEAEPLPGGSIRYTPPADSWMSDTFAYEVCDLGGLCDTAVVWVSVAPEPIGPTAVDDAATVQAGSTVELSPLANDVAGDAELDPASFRLVEGADAFDPLSSALGPEGHLLLLGAPPDHPGGLVTLGYEICDLGGLCDDAVIRVTVLPVDAPPDPDPEPPVGNPDPEPEPSPNPPAPSPNPDPGPAPEPVPAGPLPRTGAGLTGPILAAALTLTGTGLLLIAAHRRLTADR